MDRAIPERNTPVKRDSYPSVAQAAGTTGKTPDRHETRTQEMELKKKVLERTY